MYRRLALCRRWLLLCTLIPGIYFISYLLLSTADDSDVLRRYCQSNPCDSFLETPATSTMRILMTTSDSPDALEDDDWFKSDRDDPPIKGIQTTETVDINIRREAGSTKSAIPDFKCNSTSGILQDGVVRDCLTGYVIGKVPTDLQSILLRLPRGVSLETEIDRKNSFADVFENCAWGHGWDSQYKDLNASGMGATLYWTQKIIGTLHTVISQIKWQLGTNAPIRILDVPCGDMAWMSRFLKTRNDIDYTGIDIVPEIIEHHREAYKNFGWKFKLLDILSIKEIDSYDIIICQTLLQHLYFTDDQKLLKLFSESGSRLLITTSFYRKDVNEELVISADNPGRFRKLNLELPPFSLVPPLCIVHDGPPDAFEGWDHFLGIWKLPLRRIKRCKTPVPMLLDKTEQKIYSCTNWSLH